MRKYRRASGEANLATIAKKLGISISTVSRALRGESGIHPETRENIYRVARETGYLSGDEFGAASSPRSYNILALAQCTDASSDQRYLAGISAASIPLNLSILSHHVRFEDATSILDPAQQPIAMRNGTLDGLILIHRWPEEIAAHLSAKWPTVSIVHSYAGLPIDLIGTDDRQGILTLIQHLAKAGHRKIGFFGLCPGLSWSTSRFGAYVEAMVSSGLSYEMADTIPISLEEGISYAPFADGAWAEAVLERTRAGVKAWISPSAITGYTLTRFFQNRGIQIPGEVAVTGFHKQTFAYSNVQELTGMDVSDEDLGSAALRRLIHRLKNPTESRRTILLPMTFSQGQTTSA